MEGAAAAVDRQNNGQPSQKTDQQRGIKLIQSTGRRLSRHRSHPTKQ